MYTFAAATFVQKTKKLRIETETLIDFVRTKEILFHVAFFIIFELDMLNKPKEH